MNINDARKKYFLSNLWCESGSEEGARLTEKREEGGFCILRGESRHGRHSTVRCGDVSYLSDRDIASLSSVAAKEFLFSLKDKLSTLPKEDGTVLVLCLGNKNITGDSQGPLCAEHLCATYHLKEKAPLLYKSVGSYRLAVLSPGTEGQSGLDPAVILEAVAKKISPDLIIAVDALCAGCDEYLARTVQISSAGITPGSGVENSKSRICENLTGIPTVGIGIPTVISSSSLIYNALLTMQGSDFSRRAEEILENNRSFYVSPKHVDLVSDAASRVISESIRRLCEELFCSE